LYASNQRTARSLPAKNGNRRTGRKSNTFVRDDNNNYDNDRIAGNQFTISVISFGQQVHRDEAEG
jgi:hypothetical protein